MSEKKRARAGSRTALETDFAAALAKFKESPPPPSGASPIGSDADSGLAKDIDLAHRFSAGVESIEAIKRAAESALLELSQRRTLYRARWFPEETEREVGELRVRLTEARRLLETTKKGGRR